MNGKIDALTNDRSDRQLDMMQLWQQRMEENTQKLYKTPGAQAADDAELRRKIRSGEIECPTCANRKYVDGSDDPGVSFKTPQGISPGRSYQAVLSHEHEHVSRNANKAKAEGRAVTDRSGALHYATCPTCGRQYVAGGTTSTTTATAEAPAKAARDTQANQFKNLLDKMI
jgi:uncharacterized Zn finger protein (UPF0148 family)